MLHVCLEKKGFVKNISPDVKRIQTVKIISQKLKVLVQFGVVTNRSQTSYNRYCLKQFGMCYLEISVVL